MDRGKQVILWGLLGGLTLAGILFFRKSNEPTHTIVERVTDVPGTELTNTVLPQNVVSELQQDRTLPKAITSAHPLPIASSSGPQCTADEECKGPRQASCIEIRCVQGQCVYDESRCECVSAEDCDDGNPCTRNHCFSSTQKCIYIPIDNCKLP